MDEDRKRKYLDKFLTRDYQINFHTKNEINYLVIDELKIIVSDEDIKKAEEKIREEKIQLFNKYFDANIHHEIPLPGYRNVSFKNDLFRFCVKLGITGYLLFVLIVALTGPIIHYLNIEGTTKRILLLSDKIDHMDDDQKARIKVQIRKFSNSVSPFVSEMEPIIQHFKNNEYIQKENIND